MDEIVQGRPALRRKLYTGYAVLGAVLGSVQVGAVAAETGQPVWLTVSLAVYAYLGTSFGFTARSKVQAQPVVQVVAE